MLHSIRRGAENIHCSGILVEESASGLTAEKWLSPNSEAGTCSSKPDTTFPLEPRSEGWEGGNRGDEVNWGENVVSPLLPFDRSGLEDPDISSLSLSWRSILLT